MPDSSTSGSGPRPGLSLYANLLDPNNAGATVSKGPVIFKPPEAANEAASKKSQIENAALRFQPPRRPQLAQKPKPRVAFPKAVPTDKDPSPSSAQFSQTAAKPAVKSKLADWTAIGDDDDINGFYGGEKRLRGGKKRRKNRHREEQAAVQDWDDIYDPTRPNNYDEYKHSEEKIREIRDWKDRLYAHRMRKSESEKDSDEEDYRPQMHNQFAPPPNYLFAPPPINSPAPKPVEHVKTPDQPTASLPKELRPESSTADSPIGAISRPPVRYSLPPAPTEIPASEAELEEALASESADGELSDQTRSLRPGQAGFAERLMSKYGWSKGAGLGADGTGITTALSVKIEKRKKKSDAEGGGFREPAKGRIVGEKKNEKEGKFGAMSEVIVLRGMVDGMDLDVEVGDGGLIQEIGEECGEKYGRVERVYIDRQSPSPKVFVKFTSQLSALRAVNALEGRIFNGNTISALFYPTELFGQGSYDQQGKLS